MSKLDDNSLTPRRSRRKKNKSWLPWILLIASLFLAVAAGAIFASSSLFDKPDAVKNDKLMSAKDKTIVMLMGVNGVGKTTSIGKIANRLKQKPEVIQLRNADEYSGPV